MKEEKDLNDLVIKEEEKSSMKQQEKEPKFVIDEVLESLDAIKEGIDEAVEKLDTELKKLQDGISKVLNLGIPRDLVVTYIAKKAGIGITTVRKIIAAIEEPRYSIREVLIEYIAKNAAARNSDIRKFMDAYESILRELTAKREGAK